MKKSALFPLMFLAMINGKAQNIGIGTANPQNKLHVAGGLRIDTLVSGIDSGLLGHDRFGTVYSLKFTNNSGDVLRGDGKFLSLGGISGAWLLNGNTGTNPVNNFIGTRDIEPLKFRVNNIPAGEIQPSNGNTGIGMNTLILNTTGFNNSAYGFNSFSSNTTGNYNTAYGVATLQNNTSGTDNSVNGSFALVANSTGNQNTASGAAALFTNTTGSSNTANGWNALWANSTGYSNVAIGINALRSNNIGHNLVAVGDSALFSQTANVFDSYGNTAIGSKALYSNTSGDQNTAIGNSALYSNNTGRFNTATGYLALSNNTGNRNTAIGYVALLSNTSGINNTAIGDEALFSNIMGNNNSGLGIQSLNTNTTGSNNTAVGYQADVTLNNLTNATAIGNNAKVNATNKIRLGNTAVGTIEGQVAFTFPSDGRFKSNIQNDVTGLNFILKLQPVSYQFNYTAFSDFLGEKNIDKNGLRLRDQNRQMGFVAQDVEKICNELGVDITNLVFKPENEKGNYSIAYSQFVVPLVKAVQEQQEIIENQNKKIDMLVKEIELIKYRIKGL